jgi:hypothetical protein
MTQHINTVAFDIGKADAFLDRVAGLINDGAVAVMIGIGHRTGLFDTMAGCRRRPAPRSPRGGVGRTLRARVAGGDGHRLGSSRTIPTRHLRLPAEHAASLTRGASLGNFAVYAQHVGLLGHGAGPAARVLRDRRGDELRRLSLLPP